VSDAAHVTAREHGVLRVFHLSYPLSMEAEHMDTSGGLADALGVPALDARDVQIVTLSEIGDMGLAELIRQGYGVSDEDLAPLRARLDALTGKVAILRSGAFGGQPAHLNTEGGARLVATMHEGAAPPPRITAGSGAHESARGTLGTAGGRRAPSNAAMSGRVAMVALVVLFALVALMVWIGG
jgi:hypothetical protein